ncbi:hypothetical protein PKHYL_21990 [Psychrobacter sp. KH172YL61]|nr:hypothetical protein PKHYL_21990 [Psychrobacter sp. KH172YL61]
MRMKPACIAGSYVLADPNRPRNYSDEQYLKTQEQMAQLFADIPQVVDNTLRLATRCNVTLTLGINVLPDFPVPEGETIESFFRAESKRGLEERLDKLFPVEARTDNWSDFRQRYDERLAYELDIILSMGFPGYFPYRHGLYPLGESQWRASRPWTWFWCRFIGRLRAQYYRP